MHTRTHTHTHTQALGSGKAISGKEREEATPPCCYVTVYLAADAPQRTALPSRGGLQFSFIMSENLNGFYSKYIVRLYTAVTMHTTAVTMHTTTVTMHTTAVLLASI